MNLVDLWKGGGHKCHIFTYFPYFGRKNWCHIFHEKSNIKLNFTYFYDFLPLKFPAFNKLRGASLEHRSDSYWVHIFTYFIDFSLKIFWISEIMCLAGCHNRSNSFLKFTYSLIFLKNQFLKNKYSNSYWKVLENFRQLNQFAKFHSHIHIFAGIRDENFANQNEEKKISIEFTYSHISHILEKNFEMWICDAYAPRGTLFKITMPGIIL